MHFFRRYLDTVDFNMILEQHAGLVIHVILRIRGVQKLQLCQGSVEHQRRSKGGSVNYDDIDAIQSTPTADIAEGPCECKVYTDVT